MILGSIISILVMQYGWGLGVTVGPTCFGLFIFHNFIFNGTMFEHNTQPMLTPQDFGRSVNIHTYTYMPTTLVFTPRIFKPTDGPAETFNNVNTNLLYFSEMLRSWNRGKLSNYGVVSPWWFFVTRRIASKVWSPTIYGIQRSCFGVNKLQVNSIKYF